MNEEQKYLFDVNGFIVIENVREFFTHVHAPFPFPFSVPERSSSRRGTHACCVSIVIVWYLLAPEWLGPHTRAGGGA